MNQNTFWTVEQGSLGYDFRIQHHCLELGTFDIPVTRHSGAGTENFPHNALTEGSPLHARLIKIFGEVVANEILYAVLNISGNPVINKKKNAEHALKDWLDTIPEDATMLLPWDNGLKDLPYSGGDFSKLESIGLKHVDVNDAFILQDFSSGKELGIVPKFYPFHYGSTDQTRVLALYHELYIFSGDRMIEPFANMSAHWKVLDSELTRPYLTKDKIYLRFCPHRYLTDQGVFLLELDHSGKILGKRTLSAPVKY